jgi:uncharacterized protein YnzC (UPF0291/DUF896 family)
LDRGKTLEKCYIWNIVLYGAEILTLRKIREKYLENFEMWCWRRLEKISWADRVKNDKLPHRVKEERNIAQTIIRRLHGLVTACAGTAP